MARVIIIFCLCLTFIPSCKSTQEYKKQYYPIGLYLESELAQIDSFKLPITRCFTENKKSDSTIIELKYLRAIVNELLLNNLSKTEALNDFNEAIIKDLQLDFITISYTSSNNSISKIDLYIDPRNEKVKSLYAEKSEMKNDTSITKKILWTSGSQLLINSIYQTKEGNIYNTEQYKWSFKQVR
jgi:hypothetical protein